MEGCDEDKNESTKRMQDLKRKIQLIEVNNSTLSGKLRRREARIAEMEAQLAARTAAKGKGRATVQDESDRENLHLFCSLTSAQSKHGGDVIFKTSRTQPFAGAAVRNGNSSSTIDGPSWCGVLMDDPSIFQDDTGYPDVSLQIVGMCDGNSGETHNDDFADLDALMPTGAERSSSRPVPSSVNRIHGILSDRLTNVNGKRPFGSTGTSSIDRHQPGPAERTPVSKSDKWMDMALATSIGNVKRSVASGEKKRVKPFAARQKATV